MPINFLLWVLDKSAPIPDPKHPSSQPITLPVKGRTRPSLWPVRFEKVTRPPDFMEKKPDRSCFEAPVRACSLPWLKITSAASFAIYPGPGHCALLLCIAVPQVLIKQTASQELLNSLETDASLPGPPVTRNGDKVIHSSVNDAEQCL